MEKVTFVQKAVILHPQEPNKFLLLKRNLNDKSRPGDFDIPGGSVKGGELHEEALVREITEETGLKVTNIQPILVKTTYDNEKQSYFLYIGYSAIAESIQVTLSANEHSVYEWLTLEEFKQKSPEHILLKQLELVVKLK